MFFLRMLFGSLFLALSAVAVSISSIIHAAPALINMTGITPRQFSGTQTGQGTFFTPGLGACGIVNTGSDFIAAVGKALFDSFPGYPGGNPNNDPICKRRVTATYQGRSVTVAITDRCEACAETDLDFSPAAFQQLADLSVGRIYGMTWVWD